MGEVAQSLGLGSTYTYKDQAYTIAPFKYEIQGRYELYLQEEALKAYRRMKRYLSDDEARNLLKEINKDIASGVYTFGNETVAESMKSVPQFKYLFWLCVEHNHKGIDKTLTDEMVDHDLDAVMTKVAEANADPFGKRATSP